MNPLYISTAAIIIALTVRALNSNGMSAVLTKFAGHDPTDPVSIPKGALPWLVLFFGTLSVILDHNVAGDTWTVAIASGFTAAATSTFGYSLAKTVPVAGAAVRGRSSRMLILIGVLLFPSQEACHQGGANGPNDADAAGIIDAGATIAKDVCSLIDGIDDGGIQRSICASVDEIATVASFILTLRQSDRDAGATRSREECSNLPGSQFCATSREKAKAILFLVQARSARLVLDGGAR